MTIELVEFGWRNILGIIAGGLANFILGGLWYMILFSKRWIEATGRNPEDFKDASPGGGMLLTLGGCIVTTAVVALVFWWAGGSTPLDGIIVGVILGAGVAAMEGMKTAVYNFDDRVRPWMLFSINGSYAVCGITLSGLVYGLIA
jgi:hypothetical protein